MGILRTTSGAFDVEFSPDGTLIATGDGNSHTVWLWNSADGSLARTLTGDAVVRSLAFSPDGTVLVTNGGLDAWNPMTGQRRPDIDGGGACDELAFNSDGLLATANSYSVGTGVRLLSPAAGQIRTLTGTYSYGVAFSADGAMLATSSGYEGPEGVRLWNTATGELVRTLSSKTAYALAFSGDQLLAIGDADSHVRLWNPKDGQILRAINGSATVLALSPNGKLLATADGNSAYLWDVATGKQVRAFAGHTNLIQAVAFSPDGLRLGTAGGLDGTVRIWDITSDT